MIFTDSVFLKSLEGCEGFEKDSFEYAHQEPAPVSIRLNPHKRNAEVIKSFQEQTPVGISWCENGYYLKSRPVFAKDPLWHAGAYYVQEASSMFIEYALKTVLGNQTGLKALDLCAAPGGKSTLLASMSPFQVVVANEIIHSRIPSLMENAIKWGSPHVIVSNNDPIQFENLPGFFDLVLVDAPCSGSGLFRKDPQAFQEWKPELPEFCSGRQKRILNSAVKAITEHGYLLYSTCSYSSCENEENLDYLMDTGEFESVELPVPDEWGIVVSESPTHRAHGYRFYPNRLQGEGFFCALLKKKVESKYPTHSISPSTHVKSLSPEFSKWLNSEAEWVSYQKENEIFVQLAKQWEYIRTLDTVLKLKKKSLRLGNLIRGEIIPDHELAVSVCINNECNRFELTRDQAISYLKREELKGMEGDPGWYWITYSGIGLGWAKMAGGKFKNHYPMNWRILKQD